MTEIKGTVKQILPTTSGTSAAGKEWQKNGVVVTVPGEYPKDVAFTAMGKIVPVIEALKPAQDVTVSYDISSREYNGKWYTDVKAWKIDIAAAQAPAPDPIAKYEGEMVDDLSF